MQAIVTKYHGPTNSRGARISAKAWAGRVSIPYPHELNSEQGHEKAARALMAKFNWFTDTKRKVRLACGGMPDTTGYAFVIEFVDEVGQ